MSSDDGQRCAGVDVGSKELVVAVQDESGETRVRTFGNEGSAHRALIRWLRTRRVERVVVEASGVYHLDFCMAVVDCGSMQIQVANPRTVKAFGLCDRHGMRRTGPMPRFFHAAKRTRTTPEAILEDMEDGIRVLGRRIDRLEQEALSIVRSESLPAGGAVHVRAHRHSARAGDGRF